MESIVALCKENAVRGMEIFLKTFSHVPDDRLNWAPSPTAKSAIRIAAHTAVYAGHFAKMIRDRRLPSGDEIPEFVARIEAAERALTTRTEIESLFRKNTDEVLAALDSLTPEAIGTPLDSSLWFVSMTFLMNLPGTHALSHAAQIDYLQTCWGDQKVHF
ncbi:MAG: DinB family protein [Fimbriimonadaceae bacterium]